MHCKFHYFYDSCLFLDTSNWAYWIWNSISKHLITLLTWIGHLIPVHLQELTIYFLYINSVGWRHFIFKDQNENEFPSKFCEQIHCLFVLRSNAKRKEKEMMIQNLCRFCLNGHLDNNPGGLMTKCSHGTVVLVSWRHRFYEMLMKTIHQKTEFIY